MRENDNQCDQSTQSTSLTPKPGEDAQSQPNDETIASTNHIPKSSSEKVAATESPPTQLMDRSDNSSYRIPRSVFSRNKSTSPGEWSTLSNESLFSIHMDTMSFTKDQIFWRSGELGLVGEPSTSETTEEVIKESTEGLTKEKLSTIEEHKTHHSRDSGTSTTSFAFPLLTGELEKDASTKINSPVTVEPEKPPSEAPPNTDTKALSNTPSKTEASSKADSETPTPTPNQSSWFSCLPCCRSTS